MNWIKKLNALDVFIAITSLLLIALALIYAKQRIVFTDTAVYFANLAEEKDFTYTPRYVALLAQILPLTAVYLGTSLKYALLAYSLNLILIPIASIILCRCVFKNRTMAVAIILFYTIMNAMLFYYPVTEFQMGLCLIFVLHAYLIWNSERKQNLIGYVISCLLLVVTIIFSHPQAILVFYGYLGWVLLYNNNLRARKILIPTTIPVLVLVFKKVFQTLFSFQTNYDDTKMNVLNNFKTDPAAYFTSPLAKAWVKMFTEEYFLVIGMVIALLVFFIVKRRWILLAFFGLMLFSFWLLITVSFNDLPYNYYTEHQYQPMGFFIAFVFAYFLEQVASNNMIKVGILSLILFVSVSKIIDNSRWLTQRLTWYERCISLMQQQRIERGVLPPIYTPFGNIYDYWASGAETSVLSSLINPNKTVILMIEWETNRYNEKAKLDTRMQTQYFFKSDAPFLRVDSFATKKQLEDMQQVYY